MIRRFFKFLSYLGLAALALALLFGWWLFGARSIAPAMVVVEPKDPFYKIVVNLKNQKIIGSPWLFSKVAILTGVDRQVIPGRYDFTSPLSNYAVLRKLWMGDIAIITVTIPEGYTLRKIGNLLGQKCGADRAAFDSLVHDSLFLARLGVTAGYAEGYLFPSTYKFRWGIPASEALHAMVRVLFAELPDTLVARGAAMGYSLDKLLTMASIVEWEGMAADELPRIASVYYNRLRKGMRLQADPTVIYGMGELNRKLLLRDYKYPSRYNTYLHNGLPPTPICSPGMNAIRAVLYPEQTGYLYFVADGTGRHLFNTTYEQHLRDTHRIKREIRRGAG